MPFWEAVANVATLGLYGAGKGVVNAVQAAAKGNGAEAGAALADGLLHAGTFGLVAVTEGAQNLVESSGERHNLGEERIAAELAGLPHDYCGVSHDALRRAMRPYAQYERAACGPHAAGRARIILGRMEPDEMRDFVCSACYTFGGAVGPLPVELARYADGRYARFNLGELVGAVRRGTPVVFMRKVGGGANLHYEVAVGTNSAGDTVFVLGTDNLLSAVPTTTMQDNCETWLSEAMIVF